MGLFLCALLSIFALPVFSFENHQFWVRGFSHMFWVLFYLVLCAIGIYQITKEPDTEQKKLLNWLCFYTFGISFLLSLAYVTYGIMRGTHYFLYDFPSIWCTFFVLQLLFYAKVKKISIEYIKRKTRASVF